MKHRKTKLDRGSKFVRKRTLQFDRLEERRLFAGMDGALRVLVFEDPLSVRTPSASTTPAAERVVYVDLNRDGSFQTQEPWEVTDSLGAATFRGLSPGDYFVRLLSQKSVLETTSPQPEETGRWSDAIGVTKAIDWESENVGWFASAHSLQKWNLADGKLLRDIDLDGEIIQVAALDPERCIALIRSEEGSKLLVVNRSTGEARTIVSGIAGIESFVGVGDDVLVLAAQGAGKGLYRVPSNSGSSSLPDTLPVLEIHGLSSEKSEVHAIGARDLVIVERIGADTRISSWQNQSSGWQLVAERMFMGESRFASHLSDSTRFVIETAGGLAVLSNASGLPVLEMLEQASGPAVFDSSRNLLLTQSKAKAGVIQGWSTVDWKFLYDLPMTDSAIGTYDAPSGVSLGYLKDQFIAVKDGKIYRHILAASVGASATISDSTIRQVAIGLRTRGVNRAPTLGELPDFATDEDIALTIPQQSIASRGNDEDGDPIYYFVRTSGDKGNLTWSSSSFASFVPNSNANGVDQWGIRAFDGRSWSEEQFFQIDIRPVNDPPSALLGSTQYRVPELSPGAILGRLEVTDPDSDAVYRYAVSDGRFVVANGVLSLAAGVALDYEAATSVVVTVSAVEINQKDSISKQVTVQVEDRNDPPQAILFQGAGAIPEKTGPYVVGTVSVVDQDRFEVFDFSVSDPRFEVVRNTIRVKPGAGIVYQDPGWVELTMSAVSRMNGDTLNRSERFRIIKDETPYHNDLNPMDVDGDGAVTPLDPLRVVNYINTHGPGAVVEGEGEGGGQIDVDGDGQVTPIDILIIINALNQRNRLGSGSSSPGSGGLPSAEGEGALNAAIPAGIPSEEDLPGRRNRRAVR